MFGQKPDAGDVPEHSGHFCSSLGRFLSPGITNKRESDSASEAVSQPINSCAVQHSGQMCKIQGKSGSGFGSFTNILFLTTLTGVFVNFGELMSLFRNLPMMHLLAGAISSR
jgi:hypothetical protein